MQIRIKKGDYSIMVKNIEETESHYPFHGSYKGLLPSDDNVKEKPERQSNQDRADAMRHAIAPIMKFEEPPAKQIEVVGKTSDALAPTDTDPIGSPVAEAKPCAAVQENAQKDPQWIADLIGDDFKMWGPGLVAIEASTGTGKTSLVLNQMLDWAEERACKGLPIKRTLVLCNRVPLKVDILRKLDIKKQPTFVPDGFGGWTCIIDELQLIHIQTYQYYETLLLNDPEKAKWLVQDYYRYDCIVCDEAHYFFDDSGHNENTGLSYEFILQMSKTITVIAMTATPGDMFELWRSEGRLKPQRYYLLQKKVEYIKKVYVYKSKKADKTALLEILRNIPQNEKALVQVNSRQELIDMRAVLGDTASYYCSSNNAGGALDKVEDCVKDEKLQKRILFTTEALYNGIDIKDKTLRHILIESAVPRKIIQMQGRKRPLNTEDVCTVYYKEPTAGEIGQGVRKAKEDIEYVEAYKVKRDGDNSKWEEQRRKSNYWKISKRCTALVQNIDKGTLELNDMAVHRMEYDLSTLQDMQERGYWATMRDMVWDKTLCVTPVRYASPALQQFFDSNVDIQMSKKELQDGLSQAGLCSKAKMPKSPSSMKKMLEEYGVTIETKTKNSRVENKVRTTTYWTLKKM